MTAGNISEELRNTIFPIPSTTPTKVLHIRDATYGKACILMYVLGAPGTYAVASAGFTTDFAIGCLAIDTSGGAIYMNSNATAPSWTAQV